MITILQSDRFVNEIMVKVGNQEHFSGCRWKVTQDLSIHVRLLHLGLRYPYRIHHLPKPASLVAPYTWVDRFGHCQASVNFGRRESRTLDRRLHYSGCLGPITRLTVRGSDLAADILFAALVYRREPWPSHVACHIKTNRRWTLLVA